MSAVEMPLAMVDTASPSADVDTTPIPSLDEQVESETPAVETDATKVETKTEEKPPVDSTTDAAAQITPKVINSQLQELAKTNKPLATAIHAKVADGLRLASLLKETETATVQELKAKLSAPDSKVQEQLDAVAATDTLLYEGGAGHKELADNVYADLQENVGDAAPERLAELTENLLSKVAEVSPEAATRFQRSAFLEASTSSGLIKSLNSLHSMLSEGKTSEAKNLLASIGKFFSEELKANGDVAKTHADAKAAAEKATTATVTKLRAECETGTDKEMNQTMGGYLRPLLQNQLKGLTRTDLESLAMAIRAEARSSLGKDPAYVKEITAAYNAMKTSAQKTALLVRFKTALTKDDFGKKLVERVAKQKYPDRFVVKPAAPKAPASIKVTIGGVDRVVFQLEKKPTNLVRSDTQVGSRLFTSNDLEMLLMAKGIGLVPNKEGKGHSFVQWKR